MQIINFIITCYKVVAGLFFLSVLIKLDRILDNK